MPPLITRAERIFMAGHRGMAGCVICRALQRVGYTNLLTATRAELDLEDGPAVQRYDQLAKGSVSADRLPRLVLACNP